MFDELLKLQELSIIDTRTLLWGDANLGYNINCKIVNTVQKFISNSERFSLLLNYICNFTFCKHMFMAIVV
jgi:hypothetical protein